VTGALINDSNGLLLTSQGTIDTSRSGAYTSIVSLASSLASSGGGAEEEDMPVITIETSESEIMVRKCRERGVTIAVRVEKEVGVEKEE